MISLSAYTFDPVAFALFARPDAGSLLPAKTRRVSRTATLDGGCYIYDTGQSDSDSDIVVVVNNPSTAVVTALQTMVSDHAYIVASVRDGCYQCVPESLTWTGDTKITFKALIYQRISE